MTHRPIGWVDENDPNGVGYQIMTEVGLKIYDKDEHQEYLIEKHRVEELLNNHD
jgi:hypothetical protein